MPKTLVVIGAGPKGAAIATKAAVLSHLKIKQVNVVLFDPDGAGAAWDGKHGYTDGEQELCTSAIRDLGYPYDRATPTASAAAAMQAAFSWSHFSVESGHGPVEYRNWVELGTPRPRHKDFAEYIAWAVRRSGFPVLPQKVVAIERTPSGWKISAMDPQSGSLNTFDSDGVVVTGSGGNLSNPLITPANPRVFDGRSFWGNQAQVLARLTADPDPQVVIIGGGGTGAAIAAWFCRAGVTHMPITIVGSQPTLWSRAGHFFEDKIFSDDSYWSGLTTDSKWDFVRRLSQGTVWESVLDKLSAHPNIVYHCAHAVRLKTSTSPVPLGEPVAVEAELGSPPPPQPRGAPRQPVVATGILEGTVFIDARGFDAWDFLRLLHPSLRPHFSNRTTVEDEIDFSLSVGGSFPHPGLHIPMHGWIQGPGAANLMALGWMADRILSAY